MLSLESVSISLGGTRVLSEFSLSVAPGEIVALTGPNGSGKSTAGRLACAGLLAEHGRVEVDGVDPASGADARLRVRALVGVVGQDPRNQIVSSLVRDEVAFGPRNLGLDEAEVETRVAQALARVGLTGFEERVTTELSGGEQQRLALAGVLAMCPRYLVLDEPTSQLDPAARAELRGLFQALAHEQGMGMVLITHDAHEIALADRVVSLGESRPDKGIGQESAANREGNQADIRGKAGENGVVPRKSTLFEKGAAQGLRAMDGDRTDASSALDMRGVSYSYGVRPILDGVDLRVQAGEIALLSGASGAGKTTLAALAAGVLEPDAGTVRVDGVAPTPGAVGLSLQNPEQQFFCETVADELAFAPRNRGLDEAEVERCAHKACELAGLGDELLERSPFSLSGGQARRVALASVLTLDAPVYIFDEPTSGLDAEGREFVHDMARELAQAGRAVLVISHDVEEWARATDRVVHLENGRIASVGEGPDSEVTKATNGSADDSKVAEASGAPSHAHRSCQGRQAPSRHFSGPLGAYVKDAPLSRIDARVKIAVLTIVTVGLFMSNAPVALAGWCAAFAFLVYAARLDMRRVARSLKPVAFLLLFTVLVNLVSCNGNADVTLAGPVGLSAAGGARGVTAALRIVLMLGFSLAVVSTTSTTELSRACVWFLRPLAHLGVPVSAIGAVFSLALRFIPLVSEELARIRLAQIARGVRFDEGSLIKRVSVWASVLTPLVVGLFRRADALSEAMAARCYGAAEQGRTSW